MSFLGSEFSVLSSLLFISNLKSEKNNENEKNTCIFIIIYLKLHR